MNNAAKNYKYITINWEFYYVNKINYPRQTILLTELSLTSFWRNLNLYANNKQLFYNGYLNIVMILERNK